MQFINSIILTQQLNFQLMYQSHPDQFINMKKLTFI